MLPWQPHEVNIAQSCSYYCDDWVLNDTATGDIALIQSLLGQVAEQSYHESRTRSGRVMRPPLMFQRQDTRCVGCGKGCGDIVASFSYRLEETQSRTADKSYTAQCHYK